MSPPEIHSLDYKGVRLRTHLTHADALAHMQRAGLAPAPIPPGCNTVLQPFTLASGETALAICQRGIAPIARDDERQVNGWSLLVLLTPGWAEADAAAILRSAATDLLEIK